MPSTVTVNLKWQLYEQRYSSEENTKSRMFIAYACYLSPLCRGIWLLLDCLQSSFSLHWLCSEHGSIGCMCSERGRRRNVLSPVLSLVLFSAHPTLSLATWSVEGIKRDCSQSRFIEDAVTQSISFLLSIVQNTLTLTAQVSFKWPTPPCMSWIRVSLLPMVTVALVASLATVRDRGVCCISSLVWAPSG